MPNKNVDSFFTIARQHDVCQDYVISSLSSVPHLILCDGCSTSKNTDVGARLLAISAQKILKTYFTTPKPTLPGYAELGLSIIEIAQQATELLDLEQTCLDATLLLAFPLSGYLHVYVYGDGYLAAVNQHGELEYHEISYAQNMPYYLIYRINEARRNLYLSHNNAGRQVLKTAKYCNEQEQIQTLDYDAPLIFHFSADEYRLIALCSDGVASFVSLETNHKIPVEEVLRQLVAYKTTKGDFVKRRAKRLLKNYQKQDIYPVDDLSIATILLGS